MLKSTQNNRRISLNLYGSVHMLCTNLDYIMRAWLAGQAIITYIPFEIYYIWASIQCVLPIKSYEFESHYFRVEMLQTHSECVCAFEHVWACECVCVCVLNKHGVVLMPVK